MMNMLRALAALLVLGTAAIAQPVGQIPAGTVWGNSTASRATASAATMTALLDRAFCTTQNAALYRNVSAWVCLASANNGVWITSGTGVPSISSTLPNAVQDNITRLGTIGVGVWNGTPITTAFIGDNQVTDVKLRQGAALSVIGRSANLTGNVADIVAGSDKQVFRRDGTSVGFGAIDLSQAAAVGTSILGTANGGTGAASFTTGLPIIGAGSSPLSVGTKSGNTTQFVTTTGIQTSGRCVEIDANGNHIATSQSCASGAGVTSLGGATGVLTLGTGLAMSGQALQVNGNNAIGAPNFRGTLNTSQNLTNVTWTVIDLTAAVDSGGYWNAVYDRYLPTVSGTYVAFAALVGTGTFASGTNAQVGIGRNGSSGTGNSICLGLSTTITGVSNSGTATCFGLTTLNGSTDYLQLDGFLDASSGTPQALSGNTYMIIWRIGP